MTMKKPYTATSMGKLFLILIPICALRYYALLKESLLISSFETIPSTADSVDTSFTQPSFTSVRDEIAYKQSTSITDPSLTSLTATATNTNGTPQTLEVEIVLLLSMQRSSSTTLLNLLDVSPCFLHFDEFYNNDGRGWGNGALNGGQFIKQAKVLKMTQAQLLKALRSEVESVARKENKECGGKYVVGVKMFPFFLKNNQHKGILTNFPNLTTVVLERNMEDRWKSKYVAETTGDWKHEGQQEHKDKIANMDIPPLKDYRAFCKQKGKVAFMLCHFPDEHIQWYRFIRNTLSEDKRVEVSFLDVVLNNGTDAYNMVARALPVPYQHIFPLK
mmetsp:Transcript_36613/g.42550  ORF Transcript_36613/g.42550 Transcript_36613/m.42550 type:complete len:332 (-) Transcript_36613:334-1329(-)